MYLRPDCREEMGPRIPDTQSWGGERRQLPSPRGGLFSFSDSPGLSLPPTGRMGGIPVLSGPEPEVGAEAAGDSPARSGCAAQASEVRPAGCWSGQWSLTPAPETMPALGAQ